MIFKNRFIYWISILFFLLAGTFFIPINTQPFSHNYGIGHTIFVLSMSIFSIAIFISIIDKKQYAIKLINIYIIITLIINFKSFLFVFLSNRFVYNNYIYKIDISIFLLIFLFLVNKYKSDFGEVNELDEIGKNNDNL